MDRIRLSTIVAHGKHGANPGERDRTQPFHLDLDLDIDLTRAGSSDDLADTVDYAKLYDRIVSIVEEHSYALLERLGTAILDEVMRDGRVHGARVTIAKPELLDGATPRVTMRRERPSR